MSLVCPRCKSDVIALADNDVLQPVCQKCKQVIDLETIDEDRASMPASPRKTPARVSAADEDKYCRIQRGDMLGGCRIEEMIGAGGMSVVYKATQVSLNRPVAIKILPKRLAAQPAFVERFAKESAALAALNHPNIITIIDRGHAADTYFFVMEYVEGATLKRLIGENGLSPADCVKYVGQMCSALDYAHRKGIIHRDIKPRNIMVNSEGNVKIADFGLAHLTEDFDPRGEPGPDRLSGGTEEYMSPEQRSGAAAIDGRADLYSLGVVFYEALTGKLPPKPYVPPNRLNPRADPRLNGVLERALQADPGRRYPSSSEFWAAVEAAIGSAQPLAEVCPQCKAANPETAQKCLQCGASLARLFENCPECRHPNRREVTICRKCGLNLAAWRENKWQAVSEINTRIPGLVRDKKFDEALKLLAEIVKVEGQGFAEARRMAKQRAAELLEQRKAWAAETFEAGRKLAEEHQYEKALQRWQQIPKADMDVSAALAQAQARMKERAALVLEGDQCWERREAQNALARWRRAAVLWPDNSDLKSKITHAENQLSTEKIIQSYLTEAKALRARKDYAACREACQKALALSPHHAAVKQLLDSLEAQQLEEEIESAVRKGDACLDAYRYEEAVEWWRKAAALLPPGSALGPEIEDRIAAAKGERLRRRLVIAAGIVCGLAFVVLIALVVRNAFR